MSGKRAANIARRIVARSVGLAAGICDAVLKKDERKGAMPCGWRGTIFRIVQRFRFLRDSATGRALFSGVAQISWWKGCGDGGGRFSGVGLPAALGALLVFAACRGFWRYVSLASVSAAAAMRLLVYFFWAPHFAPPISVTVGSLAARCSSSYSHDANLQRLVEGKAPNSHEQKKRKKRNEPDRDSGCGSWARRWQFFSRATRRASDRALGASMPNWRARCEISAEKRDVLARADAWACGFRTSEIAAAIDGAKSLWERAVGHMRVQSIVQRPLLCPVT